MVSNDMNTGDYTPYQNLKLGRQTYEVNNDADSSQSDISYGPGIVQKLCARFLQLSKEPSTMPPLRSPRFKRRKITAENNFAVVGEIRRCSKQIPTTTQPTNEIALKNADSNLNYSCCKKDETHLAPAVQIGNLVQPNGTYLYRAAVIPTGAKANRKAKTIESIREKFEKCSSASSAAPLKTISRVRFRRASSLSAASIDAQKSTEIQRGESNVQLPVLNGTVRVVVELAPNDENPSVPLTVEELCGALSTPSMPGFADSQQQAKDQINMARNDGNDDSGIDGLKQRRFQFEAISTAPTTSTTTASRVQMPNRREGEEGGLEEVHRLLRKFSIIREQRAKEDALQDVTAKSDNVNSTVEHHDRLVQLQQVQLTAASHLHSSANSGTHRAYVEKKESLKNISSNNRLDSMGSLAAKAQCPVQKLPEETDKSGTNLQEEKVKENAVTSTTIAKPSVAGSKKDAERPQKFGSGTELKSEKKTQRKSLTAKYLEKKNQVKQTQQAGELQEEPQSNGFPEIHPAEDEGPVRQSLLSLVMDEDVPELMEAMAEKLEFVFEDLPPSVSSAGEGILRNSSTRARPRSKETKLGFNASPPTVFTYPDEESAVEKSRWDEGEQITFKVYRELCQREKERSARESCELERLLRPSLMVNSTDFPFVRSASLLEEPSMAESLLGVTGRISYNNVPMSLTRFSENAVSLIAGK